MRRRAQVSAVLVLGGLAASGPFLPGCAAGPADAPPAPGPGDERGPCLTGNTCNDSLTCASGVCVRLQADAGATGGSSGSGGRNGSGGSANGGATGSGGSSSGGHDPIFLSLGTNTSLLRSLQTLTVSAVLTDPDGIADLIGGNLFDPSNQNVYGTFTTSADEGSYSLTLSWAQINMIEPINADPTGVDRPLRAQFFDAEGHMASRDVTIKLRCATGSGPDTNTACCDGTAIDMNESTNCGACGHRCPSPTATLSTIQCSEDRCMGTLASTAAGTATRQSCASQCAALGYTCIEPDARWTPALVTGLSGKPVGVAAYAVPSAGIVWDPILSCTAVPPTVSPNYSTSTFHNMWCACALEPAPSWYSQLPSGS